MASEARSPSRFSPEDALHSDKPTASRLLPPLRQLGELRVDVLAGTGPADPVPITAVGSHDTASAMVRVPAASDRFATSPVERRPWSGSTRRSRCSPRVDGTVRYLRNVMGPLLLQESLRAWRRRGPAGAASGSRSRRIGRTEDDVLAAVLVLQPHGRQRCGLELDEPCARRRSRRRSRPVASSACS